jgi:predicted nuclease of predicted toxin-antitoxin system
LKLLLDENLSPRLVPRLAELGVYAMHVAHAGRAGLSDAALFRYAFEQDMAVVTLNAADFLTLAADCELHPGLIVLRVGGLTPEEQWQHLEPIVQLLAADPASDTGLVNEAVEILGPGRFRRYPLP